MTIIIKKKLARTTWRADGIQVRIFVLKESYTGSLPPVLDYDIAAWETAAQSNLSQSSDYKTKPLRLITEQ